MIVVFLCVSHANLRCDFTVAVLILKPRPFTLVNGRGFVLGIVVNFTQHLVFFFNQFINKKLYLFIKVSLYNIVKNEHYL